MASTNVPPPPLISRLIGPDGIISDPWAGFFRQVYSRIGGATGNAVFGPGLSVNNEIALFSGTTGGLLKRATGTGPVKVVSGVASVAAIDLTTSEVTGALPAAKGGTGLDSSGSSGVSTILAGTWSIASRLALLRGGTNADLSATGGAGQVLKQASPGAAITVAQLGFSELSGTAASSQVATATFTAPTQQRFASGSGTYTTPSSPRSPLYIRVRLVGGGGGGSGSGTAGGVAAGAGGNTTFGAALLTANGGSLGAFGGTTGGAGGTGTVAGPAFGTGLSGARGDGSAYQGTTTQVQPLSGAGANSAFGGGGPGVQAGVAGSAGITNTGGGGSGGGCSGATTSFFSGTGGGAGGFVDAIITSPSATYAYAVGAAGTAGGAGTSGFAGGAGGSGYIEVSEYYQ